MTNAAGCCARASEKLQRIASNRKRAKRNHDVKCGLLIRFSSGRIVQRALPAQLNFPFTLAFRFKTQMGWCARRRKTYHSGLTFLEEEKPKPHGHRERI